MREAGRRGEWAEIESSLGLIPWGALQHELNHRIEAGGPALYTPVSVSLKLSLLEGGGAKRSQPSG